MKSNRLRYIGFEKTPQLLPLNNEFEFQIFDDIQKCNPDERALQFDNLRLGKLIEQFVYLQLEHQEGTDLLERNIQIKSNKITIGEIDAIMVHKGIPIHLEIAYKFYLLDSKQDYNSPLAYWIGPNRKDNLLQKVDKFKNNQFPLLYNNSTVKYLNKHHLNADTINQQLFFKAQLFLPYKSISKKPEFINKDCICGRYLSYDNIELLINCDFYVPEKLDWLIIPHQNVAWLPYNSALEIIKQLINRNRSPLVWVRHDNNTIEKCFITWW